MKNIGILALVLAAVIGAGAYILLTEPAPVREEQGPANGALTASSTDGGLAITLTKDGFTPSTLTVKAGDTVTFSSTNGDPFWPASNPHPAHSIYPEFDPEEPVPGDKSWSFTFTKVGTWRYHDHLAPYYTGTITVTE